MGVRTWVFERDRPHAAFEPVLRDVLGQALAVAPAAIAFDRTCRRCGDPAHGKPRIAGRDDVSFSVSHTRGLTVLALARDVEGDGAEVGVDVEAVRPRFALERLAARVMADDELARWRTVDEADALIAFLRVWTAKEAYLKAIGIGLVADLRATAADPPGWSVTPLDVGAGAVATVAVPAGVSLATGVRTQRR